MDRIPTQTSQLLRQWHRGESKALEQLLEEHLAWIHDRVRQRLGTMLHQRAETGDYVQDAVVAFLKYGPRFHVSGEQHFRALMACIVENTLRDKHRWYTARRREVAREHPLPADSVLELDPPVNAEATPSEKVEKEQNEAWVQLGLELLEPLDREVIILRQWEGISFVEIGERMEASPDAVRMRFQRALARLSGKSAPCAGETSRSFSERGEQRYS